MEINFRNYPLKFSFKFNYNTFVFEIHSWVSKLSINIIDSLYRISIDGLGMSEKIKQFPCQFQLYIYESNFDLNVFVLIHS